MFSIISSCFRAPNKLDVEKGVFQLSKVHQGAVGLDWLTALVLITLFALSVTGVMPIGLTGSFILLGIATFQAPIPILSIVQVVRNLPEGYFLSFFMTKDITQDQQ